MGAPGTFSVVIAVLAIAVALLAVALLAGRSRRVRGQAEELPGVDPEDLDRVFAEVELEEAARRQALVDARLQLLQSRSVPVRAIRPAPGRNAVRLCFADTTVLLVSAQPGAFVDLAVALPKHPVCLTAWQRDATGTRVRLGWPPDGHVDLRAVGLDQPD